MEIRDKIRQYTDATVESVSELGKKLYIISSQRHIRMLKLSMKLEAICNNAIINGTDDTSVLKEVDRVRKLLSSKFSIPILADKTIKESAKNLKHELCIICIRENIPNYDIACSYWIVQEILNLVRYGFPSNQVISKSLDILTEELKELNSIYNWEYANRITTIDTIPVVAGETIFDKFGLTHIVGVTTITNDIDMLNYTIIILELGVKYETILRVIHYLRIGNPFIEGSSQYTKLLLAKFEQLKQSNILTAVYEFTKIWVSMIFEAVIFILENDRREKIWKVEFEKWMKGAMDSPTLLNPIPAPITHPLSFENFFIKCEKVLENHFK